MKRTIDILKENSYGEPGAWKRQAQEELEAWGWKQYSYMIAIKARRQMSHRGITQKQLAVAMGCSQQYVSLLLKGNLNLTLETIARLEKALEFSILGNLMEMNPRYSIPDSSARYLSEGPAPGYGEDNLLSLQTDNNQEP